MTDKNSIPTFDELLAQAIDGSMGDENSSLLAEHLREDPEARRLYHEQVMLHTVLYWKMGRSLGDKTQEANQEGRGELPKIHISTALSRRQKRYDSIHWQRHKIRFNAMTAVLTALAWVGFSYFVWFSTTPDDSRPNRTGNIQYVAEITGQYEPRWADDLHQNAVLLSGERLNLVEGLIEITYYDGAVVVLEGPAEFVVDSPGAGTLERGKLAARVPAEAVGFAIQTEVVQIVDLGTEFAVWSNGHGLVETQVYEGEIRLFDEANSEIARVTQGQAFEARSVASGGVRIQRIDASALAERFTRELPVLQLVQIPASAAVHIRSQEGFAGHSESAWEQDDLLVGAVPFVDDTMRGLFAFDLSDLPTNAMLQDVALVLTSRREDVFEDTGIRHGSIDQSVQLDLHLVTASADLQGATWLERQANTPWGIAGGDFDSLALATATGNAALASRGTTFRFIRTESMLSAVQDAVDSDGRLTLLVKLHDEGGARKIFRLASHFESDAAVQPRLEIHYTAPVHSTNSQSD